MRGEKGSFGVLGGGGTRKVDACFMRSLIFRNFVIDIKDHLLYSMKILEADQSFYGYLQQEFLSPAICEVKIKIIRIGKGGLIGLSG